MEHLLMNDRRYTLNDLPAFSRWPARLLGFEPCYEHCNAMTLLGLMRRRYIEMNDYNMNLATLLHARQKQGEISILREEAAVFGSNPLLACSIIIWELVK